MNLTDRTDRALTWIDSQIAIFKAATPPEFVIPTGYSGLNNKGLHYRVGWHHGVADYSAFIAVARTGYPAMLQGMKIAIEWAVFQEKHGNPGNGLLADLVTIIESL